MPRVEYATLAPTNDPVTYDDVTFYPGSNIIDTFASLRTPKVHAFGLDALEIASSGKVAYTLNDLHSLDMVLGVGSVDLVARNSNALLFANEDKSAVFKLRDDGSASLACASNIFLGSEGLNAFRMSTAGMEFTTLTGAESHAVPGASEYLYSVGAKRVLHMDGLTATMCNAVRMTSNLVVDGPTMTVPRGATTLRPVTPANGSIFYNSTTRRFEGFAADVWSGLGGVTDVDQNTYISAEDTPGANNNELKFVTAGVEAMRIMPNQYVGIGTSNAQYPLDVAGQTRFQSDATLSTGGNTNQVTPKAFVAGVNALGSSNVTDGSMNDASGIKVAGLPAGISQNTDYARRFQKSLLWNHGVEGMHQLGSKAGASNESFWEMQGGAFHLAHTNPDSGSKVSFIMRINDSDQLEMVKKVYMATDLMPSYSTVAFFGKGAKDVAGDVGYANIDMLNSFITTTTTPHTVTAKFTTFQAYKEYEVFAALYSVLEQPSSADVVAACVAGRGYSSGGTLVAPGQDRTVTTTLPTMADGSTIPDALNKLAVVVRKAVSGAMSPLPFTGYIINNADFFSDINNLINSAMQSSGSTITFVIQFNTYNWNSLSASDKAAFAIWVRDQIAAAFKRASYTVTEINVALAPPLVPRSLVAGGGTSRAVGDGVDATVVITMPVSQTTTLINAVLETPELLVTGTSVTLPDAGTVDVALAPTDLQTQASNFQGVTVVAAKPPASALTLLSTGTDSITMSIDVSSTASQTVTALYVFTSSVPLAAPVLSSTIKAGAQTTYSLATLAAGPVTLSTGGAGLYVYTVTENDKGVLSDVATLQSAALSLTFPSTSSVDQVTGLRQLVSQTADYKLQLQEGIILESSSESASSYLLLYGSSNDIPATAADTMAAIQAGATSVSGALTKL